jgi:Uma2 family endonuclease
MPRATSLQFETFADVLEQLGDIAPSRVRLKPPPGKATERDLIRLNDHTDRLYELVDGILVEKVVSFPESALAMWIGHLIQSFLGQHDLGILAGPDGGMRLMPGLVRLPDVSFVRWERLPVRGEVPDEPVAGLAPDLAVEVLSKGNTRKEMERKLKEYFLAGVRLVWMVDPARRTVRVHTAPDQSLLLTEEQALDGGDVLPGLSLPLRQMFARVPRRPGPREKGKNSGQPRRRGR